MAKKKSPEHLEKTINGELTPPSLGSGLVRKPRHFETIGDVIDEQRRLYKLVFTGELAVSDLTKLMYALTQIIQGFKAKAEMDVLNDAYVKQWSGVRFLAPAGESLPERDPHDILIEADGVIDGEIQGN